MAFFQNRSGWWLAGLMVGGSLLLCTVWARDAVVAERVHPRHAIAATPAAMTPAAMTPAPVTPAATLPTPRPPAAPRGTEFAPTLPDPTPAPGTAPGGMVWIPGGEFSMGSRVDSEASCEMPGVTRDALPVHRVSVAGFWMDATELTNAEFGRFVVATGYVTVAERTPTPEELPDVPAELLVAGSAVFTPAPAPVPLDDPSHWWRYANGASWRRPDGPGSGLTGKDRYPAVHLAH